MTPICGPWLKGQPSPLELIYSQCLIRLKVTSDYNIMTLAVTVLKKSSFQNKSHLNALESKFDLDVKYVKVNLGPSLEQT